MSNTETLLLIVSEDLAQFPRAVIQAISKNIDNPPHQVLLAWSSWPIRIVTDYFLSRCQARTTLCEFKGRPGDLSAAKVHRTNLISACSRVLLILSDLRLEEILFLNEANAAGLPFKIVNLSSLTWEVCLQ